MNILLKLILLICFFSTTSCGKKSSLEKHPGSEYPRDYPTYYE